MTPAPNPITTCRNRLGIDTMDATQVVGRNVATCQHVLDRLQKEWDDAPSGSCCKPKIVFYDDGTQDHYHLACEHLTRLWAARAYLELARVNAPQGTFPCECRGTGVYRGAGYVENGVFHGTTGTCFRCGGKGYQTPGDRKRNEYYDNHVRRIPD